MYSSVILFTYLLYDGYPISYPVGTRVTNYPITAALVAIYGAVLSFGDGLE